MPEHDRLAALVSYRVLDTAPEPVFDDITRLAARLFNAPIALVSLVDGERQWFKSRHGLDACQTPRDQAFCAHAIQLPPGDVMVVENAPLDPRFVDNPLVTGALGIRFYAGAVLTDSEGHGLGTLCVIDQKPRPTLTDSEKTQLRVLAAAVVAQFEKARAERRLQEENHLLRMTETISGVGHWRADLSTGAISWSQEVYKIYGLAPETFTPTRENWADLYPPEDRDNARKALARAVQSIGLVEHPIRLLRADGEIRQGLSRATCEYDDAGKVVAIFGVLEDVTSRKAQLEMFETAFAHAAVGMALVSLDGLFHKLNDAYCDIVGYTHAEMATINFRTITHPDDLENDLTLLGRLLAGEIPSYAMDKRYIRKDGRLVWVTLSVSLARTPDGAPKHFIAQVQDQTARVVAQDALERQTLSLAAMAEQLAVAKDAAEDAARAKAEFLATMSHELRTPLNSVIGFSRLLTESSDLTAGDRRYAERVRSAGEGLNVLIDDILDYSKLDAGAVSLETKPFSFDDLVSDTLAMMEPQAADHGVALRLAGRSAGWVEGDAFRLRQVLLNLLSNAVKFTKDASVTIDVAPLVSASGRRRVRVSVIDEGVGIAPDALGRLFNRFSQADDSITRKFGGTGLGLAISRELVELMGGAIGVESVLGQGSTFWFELDLAIAAPMAAVGPARSGRRFEGRRVLLVDDTELNRELFKALLDRRGCVVDLAVDGQDAITALERTSYDLVLMDVHMPVLDGRAASREIRRRGLTDAPIVALTAGGSPDQIAACKAAGMTDHLLKPLSDHDLDEALARHLLDGAQDQAPASPTDEVEDERQARDALEALMGEEASLKMARLLLGQLSKALRDASARSVVEEAHALAGSAGLLGFNRLTIAARALEDACRAGENPQTTFAAARAAADAAERVLSRWIARLEQSLDRGAAA